MHQCTERVEESWVKGSGGKEIYGEENRTKK